MSESFGIKGQTNDIYWGSAPIDDLLPVLDFKLQDYRTYLLKTGRLTNYRLNWETFMKSDLRVSMIYGGGRGQYKLLSSNIYRSICLGLLSVICNQRPAYEPQVINDDSKSLAQTEIANSVLNYYLKVERFEDLYKTCTLFSLIFGEGWLYEYWDATAGEIVDVDMTQDPETGEISKTPKYEGEVKTAVLSPMDVIRDYTRSDTEHNDWLIITEYVNKWDVIAIRPDLKDKLIGMTIPQNLQRYRFGHMVDGSMAMADLIPRHTFLHEKTKACPNGRLVQFTEDGEMILDSGLPYDGLPIYCMYADKQPLHNFGCTVMTSLVGLQRAYDAGMTIITTNQQTFGVQSIAIDDSSNIKAEQLVDGINIFKTNLMKGVPTAIQLCKTPAELFTQLDRIEVQMEKESGLPSILRGTPPTGVTSGTAMAYLQAQAIVFNTPLQQSYISLLERSATGLFNLLKQFANTKRIATIVGAGKASYTVEFDNNDLQGIQRVIVQAGNPVINTEAGKLQMAQDFLQKGLVTTPQEYIEVARTGDIETMTESTEKELILIRKENEMMLEGQTPIVDPGDNQPLHIREHQAITMDPEIRMRATQGDPMAQQILQAAHTHTQNHLLALQPGNPLCNLELLAVLGIPPIPAPMALPGPSTNVATPLPQNAPVGGKPVGPGGQPAPHAPVLPAHTPPQVAEASKSINNGHTQPHLPGK